MTRLHQLGLKYVTDKAFWHNYCDLYHDHMSQLCDVPIKFMEIGIHVGWSAWMWREYFPHAELHIVDVRNDCMICGATWDKEPTQRCMGPEHRKSHLPDSVLFHQVDCDVQKQLENLSANVGQFDIILDDGGHSMLQQQLAFKVLWQNIKSGGFFIIEDLHTSFGRRQAWLNKEKMPTTATMVSFLQNEIEAFESPVFSSDEIALIKTEIDTCLLWRKIPSQADVSTTCIIKKK